MGKKKIIRFVVFILMCCLICIICSKFFWEEQLKGIIRERISAQVRKEKSTLEELVAEFSEESDFQEIHRSEEGENCIAYKDLDDPLVTKVFNKFHLLMINSELNRLEDQHVAFHIYSSASLLWEGYIYGFYYSSSDEPIDVVYRREKCELEFDNKIGFYNRYHYKTNRIAENWWYYECRCYTNSNIKR